MRLPALLARLAKSVDAPDLKSVSPQGECRFESGSGHQAYRCHPGVPGRGTPAGRPWA